MGLREFTFAGTASSTYNLFITEAAPYNAPPKAVEMIEIPGRNGAYALDKGNFENVEVTYHVCVYDEDNTDFAAEISDVRNWLCSQVGYQRLEDDYNPNEYRMAIYKSGLETDQQFLNGAEFDITFECKPQRWLTSGETAVTIGQWGETETASGEIATFEADSATAIKTLTADIDPIQNLNGYSNPWVGGAGKNKLQVTATSQTVNNVTITVDANGVITLDGTATASANVVINQTSILADGTYIISGADDGQSGARYYLRSTRGLVGSQNVALTYDSGQALYLYLHISSGAVMSASTDKIYPMIRLSSVTDATFAPYENICPISGRNSVEVTVTDDLVDPTDTDTYTTSLGTTVYGGTLDVVSGELTVTHGIVDLGSLTWTWSSNYSSHYAGLSGSVGKPNNQVANCIAEKYATDSVSNVLANVGRIGIASNATPPRVWVSTGAQATAPTGNLVYELATPQTYQLTAQQVQTLLGTNNVWSTGGDVTVEYGQNPMVLVNPTLFDARPMLAVKGYGSITIGNDATISIDNGGVIGNINLYPYSTYTDWECTSVFSAVLLNTADSIECNTIHCVVKYTANTGYSFKSLTLNSQSGDGVAYTGTREVHVQFSDLEFVKGTAKAYSETVSYTAVVRNSGGTDSSSTRTPTVSINYDGNETITITCSSTLGVAHTHSEKSMTVSTIVGNSTKSALGDPMYIDLDIGECWNEDSGTPVSVNNAVSLPAELPTLPSGDTTITFDNTFTQVDIVPRWWIV